MPDLQEVCSKRVTIMLAVQNQKELDSLIYHLFRNKEDLKTTKEQWPKLFGDGASEATKSSLLRDICLEVFNNPSNDVYKNGAVKKLLCTIMKLGSEDEDEDSMYCTFHARMSTTTDPLSDKCAFLTSNLLLDWLMGASVYAVYHT